MGSEIPALMQTLDQVRTGHHLLYTEKKHQCLPFSLNQYCCKVNEAWVKNDNVVVDLVS